MEDLKNIIAKNIAHLRTECGMTQIELAEKLNYTDKAVSKWERGESLPDVTVLKQVADLFQVTVDYLMQETHPKNEMVTPKHRKRNQKIITGISILLVWLITECTCVVLASVPQTQGMFWLLYVYALPISCVVWLVFNAIWFNVQWNFLIISLLMWSTLLAIYLTLLYFSINLWLLLTIGVPGQAIILLWSRIRRR